ncbi:MAG TPA: hypothetical protein VN805_17990 [Caulobacteraceae bacterium]|nr:hypothetical protein [Caulobacteraceae bacterium]
MTAEAMSVALADFLGDRVNPASFHHADHVRVAFEMLRLHPFLEAAPVYAARLKRLTARAGHPEAYHETITVAFLALIAERCARGGHADFDAFAAANGDLFDKNVLSNWYRADELAAPLARNTFVLPRPRG